MMVLVPMLGADVPPPLDVAADAAPLAEDLVPGPPPL